MILMDFSYFFSALFRLFGRVWGAVLGIYAVSATFSCYFQAFGRGLGCCFGDFCDFSYFFLLFSSFLGGFGMLFGEFLRFQLLFPALFKLFGWVWGAVLEILGITAPQDPLTMLPTYGYCTL